VPGLSRHVTFSTEPAALAAIDRPEITLAVWDRPTSIRIGSLRGIISMQFAADVTRAGMVMAEHLARGPRRRWHAALADDVAQLATLYAEIMRLERIEVRLERVTSNACWRFHADYVAVRLITTYAGQGTQWLDQEAAALLTAGATPASQQLDTGAVGLFKGRLLAGDAAIVHRSPPIDGTGEERLLLVIDPERVDSDA
jgi:hypothetical protein